MNKKIQEMIERWYEMGDAPTTKKQARKDYFSYIENLRELHRAESPCDWTVDSLDPGIDEYMDFVLTKI